MTYVEFVETLFKFVFINMVESAFIIMFILILLKEKIDIGKTVTIIIISGIVSTILFIDDSYLITDRVFALLFMGTAVMVAYEKQLKDAIKVCYLVLIGSITMMIIELITFIPMLFIFGDNIQLLQDNIYLTLLASIPLRLFEYLTIYILYNKTRGKHEKINRDD